MPKDEKDLTDPKDMKDIESVDCDFGNETENEQGDGYWTDFSGSG